MAGVLNAGVPGVGAVVGRNVGEVVGEGVTTIISVSFTGSQISVV